MARGRPVGPLAAAVLLACAGAAQPATLPRAAECGLECAAPATELGLDIGFLQVEARLRSQSAELAASSLQDGAVLGHRDQAQATQSRPLYPPENYWDLTPGAGVVEQLAGGCGIRAPNGLYEEGLTSLWSLGECPQIIGAERLPLRIGLDVLRDSTNAPGYNPSLLPLPPALKEQVPNGEWLAVLRAGDEFFPTSSCHNPSVVLSKEAQRDLPDRAAVMNTYGVNLTREDIRASIEAQDRVFRHLPRSFVVVLDSDFEVLSRATIKMRNRTGIYDNAAIQDMRVIGLDDGRLLVSFQPYYLALSEHATERAWNWRVQESVALLHFNVTSEGLEAWVDRRETRTVIDCPEEGLIAPGPKKNMGIFQLNGTVYAVDWLAPLRVGKLDIGQLRASKATPHHHYTPVCFGYEQEAPPLLRSPWDGVESLKRKRGQVGNSTVHNGAPLVRLPGRDEWLGIGHVTRLFRHRGAENLTRHYTHQFFTIKGNPDAGHPFTMARVSPEFCFESVQQPGRCEIVQFASSLSIVNNTLLVGYGVMDCESYLMKLPLQEVFANLRQVTEASRR